MRGEAFVRQRPPSAMEQLLGAPARCSDVRACFDSLRDGLWALFRAYLSQNDLTFELLKTTAPADLSETLKHFLQVSDVPTTAPQRVRLLGILSAALRSG
eukprot:gene5498-21643_t